MKKHIPLPPPQNTSNSLGERISRIEILTEQINRQLFMLNDKLIELKYLIKEKK